MTQPREAKPLYIAGLGLISAAGADQAMNVAAVKAGINRYRDSGYFTQQKQPIKMALVPDDALPPLSENLLLGGEYSLWDQRLLQMASLPLIEATAAYQEDQPLPLLLACPEHYAQWPHQLPDSFIKNLAKQSGAALDPKLSRTIQTGRSGLIEALSLAERFLYELNHTWILVGGVDSLQRPALFRGWLDYGRMAGGQGATDTFVPGEGAGFILLTRDPKKALKTKSGSLALLAPALASEPGHLYSEADYLGEGLNQAAQQTLAQTRGLKIRALYSSMNGESYWAKELGTVLTRNSEHFDDDWELRHPADCYGDLGAASGAALIVLAAADAMQAPAAISHLICSSSDHEYRGSVVLSSAMPPQTSEDLAQET